MPATNWPAILVSVAALATSLLAPAAASAALAPAGDLVRAAPSGSAPAAIALTPATGMPAASPAAGQTVQLAGYVPRRAYRGRARPYRGYRRYGPRRPYAFRPAVRVARPWAYPRAYYRPLQPCGRRVVRVRRNGRIVTTVVRCSPVVYGPVFYGGRYVPY